MTLIGLGYKARHGKNYVADQMVLEAAKTYGLVARTYGFADALKAHCRVAFGMTKKDAPLLQMVGTDLYRRQNPDIWVNALMYRIEEDRPDIAIVADTRFLNEAAAIKSRGGFLINVTRQTVDGGLWVANDRDPNHPSETGLDDFGGWDHYIEAVDGHLVLLTYRAQVALRMAVEGSL